MKPAALALTSMLLAMASAAPRAQTPAPDQSLDRMHSVLANKPLRLELLEPQANFKVEIKAIHPMHEIFDKPAWQLDPIGWQAPGVGFDLLSVFRYVAKAAADAKREHDVHQAREEVQRAIDDYCAAQPNARTLQLCASSPAVR